MPWSKDNLPPATKNKKWSDAQIEVFVKTANAILKETGDEGEAIATGIKQAEAKTNAKQMPKIFYCKHMETGVVRYDNEMILIDGDDLKKLIPSFAGKPVYVLHQEVDLDKIENADGYVTECFYNELDGWLWAKFIAISDSAHAAIAEGWSVSNAYIPTEWGGAGVHHNVDYDRKIVNGEFTHLAIVPNPRYEEAMICTPEEFKEYQATKKKAIEELHNSKKGKKRMLNLFKLTRQEVNSVDEDTMLELENGKTVTIKEMASAVVAMENAKKNGSDEDKDDKKEKVNMDTLIKVGEEEMTIEELKNRYQKMSSKKNEDDNSEKKKDEEKENESEEEDKKEEKKNSDSNDSKNNHFEEMRNAHKKSEGFIVETSQDMLARGKSRYGKQA